MKLADTPAQKGIKLAICVPSTGTWAADFGMSLMQMCVTMSQSAFREGEERSAIVLDKRTSLLPRSRQEMLEDAILQRCTHALMVDTDQSFPPATAHRLIAHEVGCVAANIATKTIPAMPTARLKGHGTFGVPVDSLGQKFGLEKVWRVGTGLMLLDLAVMKSIPKPWFEVHYSVEQAQFIGEDWFFCAKLEEAGVDIHIDHDLSREVGHVGNYAYTQLNIPQLDDLRKAA